MSAEVAGVDVIAAVLARHVARGQAMSQGPGCYGCDWEPEGRRSRIWPTSADAAHRVHVADVLRREVFDRLEVTEAALEDARSVLAMYGQDAGVRESLLVAQLKAGPLKPATSALDGLGAPGSASVDLCGLGAPRGVSGRGSPGNGEHEPERVVATVAGEWDDDEGAEFG